MFDLASNADASRRRLEEGGAAACKPIDENDSLEEGGAEACKPVDENDMEAPGLLP